MASILDNLVPFLRKRGILAPDYASIYDNVFENHQVYLSPEGSPGLRVANYYRKLLQKSGPRSLDIGCGAGFVVEFMCSLGKEAHGVDVSAKAIEIAQGSGRAGISHTSRVANRCHLRLAPST